MSGVEIIAAGACTAVGRSLPASDAAVRAKIAHVGEHPFIATRVGRRARMALAEWLPVELAGAERHAALAVEAARQALLPLRELVDRGARWRVFVGLSEVDRPGRPPELENVLLRALGDDPPWGRPPEMRSAFSLGHAAAGIAIERAAAAIRQGEADLCLAGGVDSYFDNATMGWLEDSGRSRAPGRPWGFTPGEAAGFCLLASSEWRQKAGLCAPLVLLGAGSAQERALAREGAVCLGVGLTEAIERSLAPIGVGEPRPSRLIGDLNGEPQRADELGFALSRMGAMIDAPADVLAPAAQWGDVGAASAALFVALAFADGQRGRDPSRTTLIWASSEGGWRAAISLRSAPEMEEES